MGSSFYHNICSLLVVVLASTQLAIGEPTDPTDGFVELPFNTSFYHIQKPYDIPVDQRYSFIDGIHKLWVYSTDKPLAKNSPTNSRTEIIIQGYNYSSGIWQFEGYGFVPNGTSGVCIMQVFGASPHATTLMLRLFNGTLSYYRAPVLVSNIYDRWFRLNVIHDADASKVTVYIDGVQVIEAPGRGGKYHYFKCGVYSQPDASYYMESRWKGIKILKKM
ncbi:citrate-binding protein-like [Coffea eugenioides]|uniref:Citrate-binding protein-like n=1 Tax=Coffea arabica TaxID=13443 RepID=A0A6P6TED2_COFAR|nr:citrate-binding protein-like [Coffea arabica]XP_027177712.1 citrate-binding protein-like [Coffea eugenioides]XP_027177721.1 citrate-binding protein-like [Coffea eugenioides]